MIDLRNRPLRDTAVDRRRLVDREDEIGAVLRSLSLRFNVLLVGERGGGVSTLMTHLPRAADESDLALPPLQLVQAARAASPAAVLTQVARALDPRASDAAMEDEEQGLRELMVAAGRRGPVGVLLDSLDGRLVHGVFGRMRDELWGLADVQWVVSVSSDEEPLALTPPADQFFEVVHRLRPLSQEAVVEMLHRRGATEELDASRVEAVARASRGNPSVALRLARAALASPDAPTAPLVQDVVDDIRGRLGDPPARLAQELSHAGSSGPWDEALLKRLGWSRPRAYEVFRLLANEGYVDVATERTGRPGRPRMVFRLKDTIA